jgi:2-dehydro-3-deoxyphosphogluconate aldolase/(4S)-4-hydroxy-2-oxoglutarate aldolase
MMDVSKLLAGIKIVPVVVIEDPDWARPLAECFLQAGIKTIEVTLRTDNALESIRRIAAEVPDIIVGAGSLRSASQVKDVVSAGAQYAVAPGATLKILDAVENAKLPFVPGAATPSDMLQLLERGYAVQKFFPAESAGGINYLKSVGGPLPEISFVPTGGVTPELAKDYLALDNIFAVGGSWIAPGDLLRKGDFDAILGRAREAYTLGAGNT